MYQKWRDLLFLHWEIPPESLRPLIPPQLELDLFGGKAYVGLVPFRMTGVRPVGLPAMPWLSTFCETNVRTYVHFRGQHPGVWFFSLDAANALAVKLARGWFHLPYHFSRMYLEADGPLPDRIGSAATAAQGHSILYAGARRRYEPLPASYVIGAQPLGQPRPAIPNSLEHFLVERYILYTRVGVDLFRGYVHHNPYPLQDARITSFSENLLAANFIQRPSCSPLSHFAQGVDVQVFNLQRVSAS